MAASMRLAVFAVAAAKAAGDDSSKGDETASVRTSLVAGAGLGAFALQGWTKGERVGWYKCALVPKSEMERDVSWSVNDTHACDASKAPTTSNPMRYVNSVAAESTCGTQNLEIRHEQDGNFYYFATKEIAIGDELVSDYGPNFWEPTKSPRKVRYECSTTPLHIAVARDDIAAATALLEADTSKQIVNAPRPDPRLTFGGWTPLSEASIDGNRDMVQLLLKHGADVDHTPPKTGASALYRAAANGHSLVVKDLLSAGASPDAANRALDGMTPLSVAAEGGYLVAVKALLKAKGNVNTVAGEYANTPLQIAAKNGHTLVVKALLKKGARKDYKNNQGSTAVFLAAINNQENTTKTLLSAGAIVDLANAKGVTPLAMSAFLGHVESTDVLLQHGANPNAKAEAMLDFTPLLFAAKNGNRMIVLQLLNAGADPSLANKAKLTPLAAAEMGGHIEVIELLQQALGVGPRHDL